MSSSGPQIGEVIAGRYRVHSILGRGRGVLALADNIAFDQRVAVRVIPAKLADPVSVAKFRRESKALAKLGSQHVARILDIGTLPDGSLYFVRQYAEGMDVAGHIQKRGALPVQEAVGWILQVTEAVAEAHAYGILHRELSPERLFVAERSPGVRGGPPIVKLVDFGTAKLLKEATPGASAEHTATTVLGLSPYSSPEMLRRQKDLDVRSDVWSLGAVLYEMLCGRPPFGRDMISLAVAIGRDEPAALSGLNPDVPADLEAAVHGALAKDRAARPADTHAFAASIVRFAPPEGRVLMERIRDLAASARGGAPEEEEEELEISQVEEIGTSDVMEEPSTGDGEMEQTRVAPRASPAARALLNPPKIASAKREADAGTLVKPLPPVPRAAAEPAKATQEKTEMLGFNFVPSDPLARLEAEALRGEQPSASSAGGGVQRSGSFGVGLPTPEPPERALASRAPLAARPAAARPASIPPGAGRSGPVFAGAAASERPPPRTVTNEVTGLPPFLPPAALALSGKPIPMPASQPPPSFGPEWTAPPAPSVPRFESLPEEEPSFGRKMAMYAIGVGLAAVLILSIVLAYMILGR